MHHMRSLRLATGTILLAALSVTSGCGSGSSTSSEDSGAIRETDASVDSVVSVARDGSSLTTTDVANVATPSNVVDDGYLTTGPWAGYGFTATDPGAAQIVPDCSSNACDPPFVGKFFCMHGTVTGRQDYTGFAMLGWNVNQDTAGDAPLTWPVPQNGGLIVTVDNPSNTPLRVQLQGTNPHDSADRWCAPLVSGKLIPWGSLLTNCWVGGSPQKPLTPGTPIQQAAIIVPGLQTDLPFDFCLVDVQIQPAQANVDGGDDGSPAADASPPMESQDGASSAADVANNCSGITTNDAGPIEECPCTRGVGDPSGTACGNVGQECEYEAFGCGIVSCSCEATDAGGQWMCFQLLC
jgi:hypothetical protein